LVDFFYALCLMRYARVCAWPLRAIAHNMHS